MKQYLTDREKSILFAAIRKEEKLCKELDATGETDGLKDVCKALTGHFMYDRLHNRIYQDGYADGKVAATKWISVKDRKPHNGELVLAYHNYADKFHNDQHVIVTRFEYQDFWSDGTITHWMPLPTAPVEEREV